ncbi:MAG TPA: LysR family transcriptional regulator [Roseiarcus sp.]|nr:LysR family transcriptional regulator [Roseiarcus sp.]
MRSIPVDVLRAFVAVVEARGFTRAAEELGRSQPTISLQVKRLEELAEAPLFEKVARFELTPVGAVCFEYGKRLIRLHDDMLEEASRRRTPGARLRVGMSSEFAARLTPRLGRLRAEVAAESGYEVITDASDSLMAAFRQKALDIAIVVGDERDPGDAERWRAPLGWFGSGVAARTLKKPLPLVVPPQGTVLHEAAVGTLRDAGLTFDIVCASADFVVLASAAAAGLGVAPMIEGFAPDGLKHCADKSLPALPPITLSLLARSPALASAGRQWVADAVGTLQPL